MEMKIEPSTSNKKVMIVGGGIGGLSAARMCSLKKWCVRWTDQSCQQDYPEKRNA